MEPFIWGETPYPYHRSKGLTHICPLPVSCTTPNSAWYVIYPSPHHLSFVHYTECTTGTGPIAQLESAWSWGTTDWALCTWTWDLGPNPSTDFQPCRMSQLSHNVEQHYHCANTQSRRPHGYGELPHSYDWSYIGQDLWVSVREKTQLLHRDAWTTSLGIGWVPKTTFDSRSYLRPMGYHRGGEI